MTSAIKEIVDRELFCRCGQCEDAVRDILRTELMLCQGAKATLTKRRKEIATESRRGYFRERYAGKVAG